jgi:hypothetical protein
MKSKLGISVGLIAAVTYFIALFGGLIPLLLIVGYVLICESERWLKVSALKALIVYVAFALLSVVVGFLPDIFALFNNFIKAEYFGATAYYAFHGIFTSVISFINGLLNITENVIFIILGIFALGKKTFNLGFVDKFINNHFPLETPAE